MRYLSKHAAIQRLCRSTYELLYITSGYFKVWLHTCILWMHMKEYQHFSIWYALKTNTLRTDIVLISGEWDIFVVVCLTSWFQFKLQYFAIYCTECYAAMFTKFEIITDNASNTHMPKCRKIGTLVRITETWSTWNTIYM